jgi:hypothetical protein
MNRLLKSTLLAAALVVFGPQVGKVFASNLHPPKFVRGNQKCAVNVNRFLRKIGKHGTSSASSKSFLKFARTSSPQPGAVVFNYRSHGKGHAQIYDGSGMCWNPSQRHGAWQFQSCNASWPRVKKIYLRSY